jgi:hypothetical protein
VVEHLFKTFKTVGTEYRFCEVRTIEQQDTRFGMVLQQGSHWRASNLQRSSRVRSLSPGAEDLLLWKTLLG